ncbi:MAG: flavodoxin domain-containing protein, partial [Burkholderiales bacterium]|nr:flavodoxin domain-containing protein [Burkholderiales bacterium]
MATIGLFFGSSTGNTESAAERIQQLLQAAGHEVNLLNVYSEAIKSMEQYEYLVLGIPTWDIGEIQEDWKNVWDELDTLDLAGKKVAVFGQGDQRGYP